MGADRRGGLHRSHALLRSDLTFGENAAYRKLVNKAHTSARIRVRLCRMLDTNFREFLFHGVK
jgi:hypothetical protein